MNRDIYFLRVITEDSVSVSFNNMLLLGFVRHRKIYMKQLFSRHHSLTTDTLSGSSTAVKKMPQITQYLS